MSIKNKNKMNKLIFKISCGKGKKNLKIRSPSEVTTQINSLESKTKDSTGSIDVIDFKSGKRVGKYNFTEFKLKFT